jgi:hypothetical protein
MGVNGIVITYELDEHDEKRALHTAIKGRNNVY